MKKLAILVLFCNCLSSASDAQTNCSNPTHITICPGAYLANQTNAGMLDDAPVPCNIPGEDVLYEIEIPGGARQIFVSIINASAPMSLSLEINSCGSGICNTINIPSGNSNSTFNVSLANFYYLWVDATSSVTYDISIGADTSSTLINIPNTQGNLQIDSSGCAAPLFINSKPFFQLSYNGVFQTSPLTFAPLGTTGTICISTFFKNTSGIEGIKIFEFEFDSLGYSSFITNPSIPGKYLPGTWDAIKIKNKWILKFTDSLNTGKGDFSGSPDTCLKYDFCFDIIPVSNNPQITNIIITAKSDGFGHGFFGWLSSGCCPALNLNCFGNFGGNGSGYGHSFGFGVNDPGNPLPIELTNFNVLAEGLSAKIIWSTASETNNDYFIVEKSQNYKDWIPFKEIQGAGNSTHVIFYETTDEHPFMGLSYYRLKQVDFNGVFIYSGIQKINFEKPNMITIFPNPAAEYIKVESPGSYPLQLFLYDLMGKELLFNAAPKSNNYVLDVSPLSNGIYFLFVKQDDMIVKKEKVVIEK